MAAVSVPASPFALRVARVEDLPGILAVERASFPAPWTERMFADEFGKDWAHVWVAERESDRHVCGFAVFWTAYDEIHLLNIAVEPPSRRAGIARAMMRALLSFAAARATSHIVLEVRPTNAGAIRLYQDTGFRPVGVRPRYYADNGEDAVVMVRLMER